MVSVSSRPSARLRAALGFIRSSSSWMRSNARRASAYPVMFHAAISFCSRKGCCSSGRSFSTFRRLVQLAPLDQRGVASTPLHSNVQSLGSVQHIQSRLLKIYASLLHFRTQLAHHGGIFSGALSQSQHRFAPVLADA